jgi:hypothetical protein
LLEPVAIEVAWSNVAATDPEYSARIAVMFCDEATLIVKLIFALPAESRTSYAAKLVVLPPPRATLVFTVSDRDSVTEVGADEAV